MVERTRYEPGEFCWVGLATSDPPRAKAFYGHLFGWQAEDLQAPEIGTFTILRLRGKNVAFLYRQTREARAARVTPHWTSFISVDDVDATTARAEALGGATVRDSFDVVDTGRVATLRDPAGAIVSLWQPRSMVGAEVLGDAGSLCWNELATSDVPGARSFYGDLFDWKYENDSGCIAIENSAAPAEECERKARMNKAVRRIGFRTSPLRARIKLRRGQSEREGASSSRAVASAGDASRGASRSSPTRWARCSASSGSSATSAVCGPRADKARGRAQCGSAPRPSHREE